MTMPRPFGVALGVLLVAVGLAAPVAAQTNSESLPNLQWNFSAPGARASGMGRTFIGTAAEMIGHVDFHCFREVRLSPSDPLHGSSSPPMSCTGSTRT